MARPRKARRINRLCYHWQYLDCRSCGEPNLHKQIGPYSGRRDTLFCGTYEYRCVCGTRRVAGIEIDESIGLDWRGDLACAVAS